MKNPIIPGLNIPVHSIFCIGRNYRNHVKEMGSELTTEPMVFLKPLSSIAYGGNTIQLPEQSNEVHHEVELVVAIGKSGKNISKKEALDFVAGFGIGVDFTARDIQKTAKQKGTPWSVAKGFDGFAPISRFLPTPSLEVLSSLEIMISVNNEVRQKGSVSDMIFDIPTLVSYLSTIFTLEEGDLIFTGTPEGVSAVQPGDKVIAGFTNHSLSLTLAIK